MAASFRACGIEPGDRIAIATPNIAEWIYTFFGAVRMGATLVTLDVRYREKELEAILNESSARLLVTSATSGDFDFTQFYPTFRPRIPTVEEIFYIGGNFTQLLEASPLEHEAHVDPHTPAVMMYAADTTGQLKSVTLTHASLLACAQGAQVRQTEEDVFLCLLPLDEMGGITCGILNTLLSASKVVMLPTFSLDAALAALRENAITVLCANPIMYSSMLAKLESTPTIDALRLALIGGSNASAAPCAAIGKAIPSAKVVNLDGLAESSEPAQGDFPPS